MILAAVGAVLTTFSGVVFVVAFHTTNARPPGAPVTLAQALAAFGGLVGMGVGAALVGVAVVAAVAP